MTNYYDCNNACVARAKIELVMLPGNSVYYWTNDDRLKEFYKDIETARKEYSLLLDRHKGHYDSITLYEKDTKGRWMKTRESVCDFLEGYIK